MVKKYHEFFFSLEELKQMYMLLNMPAEELYVRYGKKRGERIFGVNHVFKDGRSMNISWRVGDEPQAKAQISALLTNPDGSIISDASEDYDDAQIMGVFSVTDEALHTTPEECLTGETVETPRGHFRVADMGVEQMQNAGYGYHHMSDDGKWYIFSNGLHAYAIPVESGCEDCYNKYVIKVKLERCAVPLLCDNGQEGQYTTYIDSDWLLNNCQEAFEEYGGLFEFLNEYTSEDSNEIISDAILADAVLFIFDPDDDEPFKFRGEDSWKYKAFANALSDAFNEDNREVSKAIDCLLDL